MTKSGKFSSVFFYRKRTHKLYRTQKNSDSNFQWNFSFLCEFFAMKFQSETSWCINRTIFEMSIRSVRFAFKITKIENA